MLCRKKEIASIYREEMFRKKVHWYLVKMMKIHRLNDDNNTIFKKNQLTTNYHVYFNLLYITENDS